MRLKSHDNNHTSRNAVFAGSLSCLLCDLASHRTVTFWGGLLAFVGMMSSSFANSITYLYIRYSSTFSYARNSVYRWQLFVRLICNDRPITPCVIASKFPRYFGRLNLKKMYNRFRVFSYGIMVGFGAGLCCPAGMLIVNEYFDSHRGLANGLSLVGTTVGSLAMPPYIEFLTSSYGYR